MPAQPTTNTSQARFPVGEQQAPPKRERARVPSKATLDEALTMLLLLLLLLVLLLLSRKELSCAWMFLCQGLILATQSEDKSPNLSVTVNQHVHLQGVEG
jgi:hypothetical protein